MVVAGTIRARCPGCGTEQECALVQSINPRQNAAAKEQLLAGELNVLACPCGRRVQLAAKVLFHDPDRAFTCHVCPGGEEEREEAARMFEASGMAGACRVVPSLNALVEKVKILDAGLEDWAIEMTKVLLLASIGELDRVLLFDRLDRDAGVLHWILFDEQGRAPEPVASPLAACERLAAREASRPGAGELEIDRVWALDAVQRMIQHAN